MYLLSNFPELVEEEKTTYVEQLPYGIMLANQIRKCNDLAGMNPIIYAMAVRGLYRLLTQEKRTLVDAELVKMRKGMMSVNPVHLAKSEEQNIFLRWLRTTAHSRAKAVEATEIFFDAIMNVLSDKGYLEKMLTRRKGGSKSDYKDPTDVGP